MAVIALPSPTTVSGQCPTYPDNAIAVTPSDTNTFAGPVGIQVSAAGNVAVVPWGGLASNVVIVGLPVGGILGFRVSAVKATSTTATGIVGFY